MKNIKAVKNIRAVKNKKAVAIPGEEYNMPRIRLLHVLPFS